MLIFTATCKLHVIKHAWAHHTTWGEVHGIWVGLLDANNLTIAQQIRAFKAPIDCLHLLLSCEDDRLQGHDCTSTTCCLASLIACGAVLEVIAVYLQFQIHHRYVLVPLNGGEVESTAVLSLVEASNTA